MAVAQRSTCERPVRGAGYAARTRWFRQVLHGTEPDRRGEEGVYERLVHRPVAAGGCNFVSGDAFVLRGAAAHVLHAATDGSRGRACRLAATALAWQAEALAGF